jgi:hypothetical protein
MFARYIKFVSASLLLVLAATISSSVANAKDKPAKFSVLKILTTPGGLPLWVAGKFYGETTTSYRSINLEPGLHTVVITLPGGMRWTREIDLPAGRVKCVAVNHKPRPPLPILPCPFPVSLSAPEQVNEGEIVTYTADVVYKGSAKLAYKWTVSPGNARIISGAGTPTITVDSTGLGGQQIAAMLVVDDGSGEATCLQAAQAITTVPAPEKRTIVGREFDTCRSCSNDDLKARLDNLVIELQNDPSTQTYLFAYGGRNSAAGTADHLLARARDYMVNQRGVDASRIVLTNGGFREEDSLEVWIVPNGAKPPQPTPTVPAGDVKPMARKRRAGN